MAGQTIDVYCEDLSTCSIEFCPNKPLIALGSYQTESSGQRRGRCTLFDVASDKLIRTWQTDSPAVLDIKWSSDQLFTVTAEGYVRIYDVVDGQALHFRDVECASADTLCLSIDLSNDKLAVSLSNGSIAVHDAATFQQTHAFHAHEFEAWTVSFDLSDENAVYTGADDSLLKAWDLRTNLARPTQICKVFDAGVTCIAPCPQSQYTLAVGSYDERLRFFDKRSLARPLSEHKTGGGLWRIKWHPTDPLRLLIANMHDGFKIVDLDESLTKVQTTRYDKHESLAYGASWSADGDRIATCSFYDNKVHLWTA